MNIPKFGKTVARLLGFKSEYVSSGEATVEVKGTNEPKIVVKTIEEKLKERVYSLLDVKERLRIEINIVEGRNPAGPVGYMELPNSRARLIQMCNDTMETIDRLHTELSEKLEARNNEPKDAECLSVIDSSGKVISSVTRYLDTLGK